ncbi:MAG TPA: YHYH protein [Acidimicrobiales bacterium]|nr:YHYH protein [Acidimicrobiales bacterium]
MKTRSTKPWIVLALAAALAGGCASANTEAARVATQPSTATVAQDCTSSATDQAVCMPASPLNLSALPLGSGKVSSSPQQGYEWVCQVPNGSQPVTTPPWINTTASTWSLTTKVAVQGDVRWHKKFKKSHKGTQEVLVGNGLPPRSGTFPVARTDPARAYNPDPTRITSHSIVARLPYDPTLASSPQCVTPVVGLAVNGIPIDDGFDADGNDAAAVETQDECHGHPNGPNGYHYHSLSPCLLSKKALTHTTQVGWALDGFGIYVEYNARGQLLTDASLDACHGRTSVVKWQGKYVDIYHYDMTMEFPYTVGCFKGTPVPAADATGFGYGGPGT